MDLLQAIYSKLFQQLKFLFTLSGSIVSMQISFRFLFVIFQTNCDINYL